MVYLPLENPHENHNLIQNFYSETQSMLVKLTMCVCKVKGIIVNLKGGVILMTIMGINWLNYQETQRSNLAREHENTRHNTATENLGVLEFGETVRSNRVNEGIRQGTLDESVRSNKMRETISLGSLAEDVRSNRAREAENTRSNLAREKELNRSNMAHEDLTEYTTDIRLMADIAPISALNKTRTIGYNYDPWSLFGESAGNRILDLLPSMSSKLSKPSSIGSSPSWGNSSLYK